MPLPSSLPRISLVSFVLLSLSLVGCQSDQTPTNRQIDQLLTEQLPTNAELKQRLDEVLEFNRTHRRLNLRDHAAWQIVHGALAYEQAFEVETADGKLVSAIDYLLDGGAMTGWVMQPGISLGGTPPRFGLKAIIEPGSNTGQGHADQWLGYLADCDLKIDQVIKAGGHEYTIEDLVRQVEHDVPFNEKREYSWTLMGLTTYRPTSHTWTAGDGQQWSIEGLLAVEIGHDLNLSACGGSHRMAGVTMAVNQHLAKGGQLTGVWKQAKEKIDNCVRIAQEFQNPDGTLSSNWFERPGRTPDLKQTLAATGHVFEFVVLSSTDEQLREPWMRRAAISLCRLFENTQEVELECGALYHALHGLALYRQRLGDS